MFKIFIAVLATSLALFGQTPEALPEGYAGTEMCGICHEEIGRSFLRNPHHLLETGSGSDWQGRSCEACHQAGAQHSETTELGTILTYKTAEADRINQSCLACHAGEETHRGRLFGAHNRNMVDCTACHSVHQAPQSPLLTMESDALCSSCHIAEKAAFNRPFRHRLHEKAIACVDCHNPHGGPPPAQLSRVSGNQPACLKCHADKRGPFPFEHAPVKLEPCTACHEPHGSANPRMLVRHDVSQLCLECHAGSMSTVGGIPPAFHDLRSARFQNCTVCHSKIHGSFINREFLR